MRLSEIAPGQKRNLQIQNFDSVWEKLVLPNCTDILDVYLSTGKIFYRGMMNMTRLIYRGSSRTDRRPRDSNQILSELFELSLKKLGMTALRSNSTFVVGNMESSEAFGQPYVIFPINGFAYTWTTQIDITLAEWIFLKNWANKDVTDLIDKLWVEKYHHAKNDWVFDLIPNNESLQTAMSKINKLLTESGHNKISPEDLVDLNAFKEYFNPRNDGLDEVIRIKTAREVMISRSYYAFNAGIYKSVIKDKLQEM